MITYNIRVMDIVRVGDIMTIFCCDSEGFLLELHCNKVGVFNLFGSGKFLQVTAYESDPSDIQSVAIIPVFELKTDPIVVARLYRKLIEAIELIDFVPFKDACTELIFLPEFKLSPSAVKHHTMAERFPGGLVVHTALVVDIIMSLLSKTEFGSVDADITLTAAIWHDAAKMITYEMTDDAFFKYSGGEFNKCIGHLCGSFGLWCMKASSLGIPIDKVWQVGHCILASHGRKDWDAAVEPKTREAFLIHQADMLSAHVANSDLLFSWRK